MLTETPEKPGFLFGLNLEEALRIPRFCSFVGGLVGGIFQREFRVLIHTESAAKYPPANSGICRFGFPPITFPMKSLRVVQVRSGDVQGLATH